MSTAPAPPLRLTHAKVDVGEKNNDRAAGPRCGSIVANMSGIVERAGWSGSRHQIGVVLARPCGASLHARAMSAETITT